MVCGVVWGSELRNRWHMPFELVEFSYTAFPANPDNLVPSIQGMLHHVLTEFSRCAHNTNLFHALPYSLGAEQAAPVLMGIGVRRRESEMHAATVAADLAKSVFQIAVADDKWKVIASHRLTRTQIERRFGITVTAVLRQTAGLFCKYWIKAWN
jgi:hypothetical protein